MVAEINGLEIHYIEKGEGPLLLLLHGWGANAELFNGVMEFASSKYLVSAPDMPGFGGSEEPEKAYDIDDYVDFVVSFVKTCYPEAKEVILNGHSHGGRVTIRLLSRAAKGEDFGFSVKKAVLTDSAGIVPEKTAEQKARTKRYKFYKNIIEKSGVSKIDPSAIDKLQRKFGSSDYASATPVMRESMVKVVNCDLTGEMPSVTIPVLLIWGSSDTATPLSDGKRMEELMPEAGLAVMEGAGHYSFLEQPVLYNRILGSFLGID